MAPFEHAQQILRRHAMAGFVVEDRHDRRAAGDEGADDHHLGHGVVRPAGVAGQPLGAGQRREEHDRVAAKLDVVLERRLLLVRQGSTFGSSFRGCSLDRSMGKFFGCHRPEMFLAMPEACKEADGESTM